MSYHPRPFFPYFILIFAKSFVKIPIPPNPEIKLHMETKECILFLEKRVHRPVSFTLFSHTESLKIRNRPRT